MRSIAFRLWVYIISLMMIILGALWFLQIGLINTFYINNETNNIKKDARILTFLESSKDLYGMRDDIEGLAALYNAAVNLVDTEGGIIEASGHVMMRGRVTGVEVSLLPKVLQGQELVVKGGGTMSGMQLVTVAMPVKYGDMVLGALFIHTPYSSIKETLGILQRQFFLVTIIAILTATLGAFIISRKFTGPVLKINNAAIDISRGKLDTRVDIKYRDEIGRLGDTINHMASELSKVDLLKRDLIANISHEFRTPLGIIRSYGEGIIDKVYADEGEREEYVRIILDEASRLSRLVDDVLDISRLQSGNINIESAPFSLSSLVRRIYNKFRVLCGEKAVRLEINCPEVVSAMGDEARIEQVMINLLNNSLNYTEENGNINIRVISGDVIRVEVEDTGKGIPEEDIPYIFDRFYKVDRTGKKSQAGTGLGLAIVKEILKGHDSSFGVESQVGKGTKFYFELKKA